MSNNDSVHKQHASLALTEQEDINTPPKIICRVGLFATNQVMLEPNLTLEKGDVATHKTYPISKQEMATFLSRVNRDRSITGLKSKMENQINTFLQKANLAKDVIIEKLKAVDAQFTKDTPKEARIKARIASINELLKTKKINVKKEELSSFVSSLYKMKYLFSEGVTSNKKQFTSMPGGPTYNLLSLNCKTYALSVLREVGIMDNSLSNWGIDMPKWSGKLNPLDLENGTVWKNPLIISKRLEKSVFLNSTPEEIEQINFNIRQNEYRNFLAEIKPILNEPAFDKLPGIKALRHSITEDEINKVQQPGQTDRERLTLCETHLKQSLVNFSKGVSYGFGTWIVDCFKRALNYLGGNFNLSLEYKASSILDKSPGIADKSVPKDAKPKTQAPIVNISTTTEVDPKLQIEQLIQKVKPKIELWIQLLGSKKDNDQKEQRYDLVNLTETQAKEAAGHLDALEALQLWLKEPDKVNVTFSTEEIIKKLNEVNQEVKKHLRNLKGSNIIATSYQTAYKDKDTAKEQSMAQPTLVPPENAPRNTI